MFQCRSDSIVHLRRVRTFRLGRPRARAAPPVVHRAGLLGRDVLRLRNRLDHVLNAEVDTLDERRLLAPDDGHVGRKRAEMDEHQSAGPSRSGRAVRDGKHIGVAHYAGFHPHAHNLQAQFLCRSDMFLDHVPADG